MSFKHSATRRKRIRRNICQAPKIQRAIIIAIVAGAAKPPTTTEYGVHCSLDGETKNKNNIIIVRDLQTSFGVIV